MIALGALARSWLAWLLAASWQLAVVVCVVAVAAWLARRASPRLRHALWLLVVVKVFLPPGLATPFSVGRWAVEPLAARASTDGVEQLPAWMRLSTAAFGQTRAEGPPSVEPSGHLALWAMLCWAIGCATFASLVAWRFGQVIRMVRQAKAVDEGPVRISLERAAIELRMRAVPEVLVSPEVSGPFLMGVMRPRIVLPEKLIEQASDSQLRAVLEHELVHWKHRDTWIGWLQVVGQGLFWFHPFVWWANGQLRQERECACDEAVLRLGRVSPQQYGETIIRVLTAARARSFVAGSLAGVFERGANLQQRLEKIMNHERRTNRFGWISLILVAVLGVILLPMAPPTGATALHADDNGPAAARPANEKTDEKTDDSINGSQPRIIETTPKVGATDVDADLREISVTFDRDMAKGMSWTGGAPHFPPIDRSRKAHWTDRRTCVAPVTLAKGTYYRLGINSTSNQNFQANDGTPVPPSAIYFVTTGASDEVKLRVRVPEIAKLEPESGAGDVDPATTELRVTFNMQMGEGMSWTSMAAGERFPKPAAGQQASWSADGLTCTLPVALEADRDYELGLNSRDHINFQSEWGVPLGPMVYKFSTRATTK